MNKLGRINKAVPLLGLMFFLVCPSLVLAESVSPTITISPPKFDLVITPGQFQQTQIKITNHSDVAIPFHVVPMDFAPKDTKGGIDFGQSIPEHSAVSWFKISPQDMLLNPKESKSVTITISPPDTLSQGSYFAAVMFQANLPSNYFDTNKETQAHIIPWIGSLFLLRYGDMPNLDQNSLTINRFFIPKINTNDNVPATLEVKNNTAFHLAPEAEFTLLSLLGPIKAHITTEETTILPGSTRIFKAEFTKVPPLGLYKGLGIVRIASFQKSAGSRSLLLLTWEGGIILALVLGILAFNVHHHKRLVAAFRAIFGK